MHPAGVAAAALAAAGGHPMHRAQLDPRRPHFQPWKAARYYTQRLVTDPSHRRLVADFLAARVARAVGKPPAPLAGFETDGLQRLEQAGWLPLGMRLDAGQVREIRNHLAGRAPERVVGGGSVQDFSVADVLACPHLSELAMSGPVLRLAGAYLGCAPTIAMVGLRRSLPGAASIDGGRLFHRDIDTWRSCKLFVYLTDVDADGGPHIYVENSHRRAGELRIRMSERVADDSRAVAVTGPAGFCFLADTFGVHRGMPPQKGERLMAQFQYAVGPIDLYDYPNRERLPEDGNVLTAWSRRLFS